jgi:hypothetical protein
MPQEQHWFARAFASEIHLQMVAKILGTVELGVASEGFKPPGQQRSQAIDGLFVVTRGFDFNQLPDGFCNLLSALFEVAEATGGFGAAGVWGFLFGFPSHE